MMGQLAQLVSALLVLGGFAGSQLGWTHIRSPRYLTLNAAGSGLLAIVAILDRQWGFILLESTWAIVSVLGMVRLFLTRFDRPRRS